ncbi:MAG TPA: hypothetical protein VFO14_13470 [Vicinamibacterales bacterium]|nr:hypothetical protein [Vicinamibacterales bacterium]
MMHTEAVETRTLTIVLPEAEWRALRAQEPDAIGWLHAQIKSRLDGPSSPQSVSSGTPPADAWWGDDY